MATLISKATGNFTAAATWNLCNSAAELDSEANSTATTTSYVASSAFAPGAVTINALAIKIASRSASPTGTFSIELYNSTLAASVANTETTINVSDFDNGEGWYVFPTNGNVLLLVATNYQVRVKSSTTSQVTLYRNATANNWTRELRTTTTQAPAASDKLIISGEHTGAGTGNDFVVTMNNTATTTFGAVAQTESVAINKRATLDWGVAASTNYFLRIKGLLQVGSSGTMNIGTSIAQVPSTSTAVLEFNPTANVDSGLRILAGATVNVWGTEKTNYWTLLTADEAAAQTVIGSVGSTTGWANSDVVCFAPTTTTSSQFEKKTISTIDSATAFTLTAGLTNAHSGTSPTQAEIGNLTRNVKIRGTSASLCGFVYIQTTAIVFFWASEFTFMGSFTTDKRGIDIQTTTGTFSMRYCSIYDNTVSGAMGVNISGSAANNIEVSNNVIYNNSAGSIQIATTSGTNIEFDENIIMGTGSSGGLSGMQLSDVGALTTNNRVSGSASGSGIALAESNGVIGTFAGNVTHSNASSGLVIASAFDSGTIQNCISWRNGTSGITVSASAETTLENFTAFGNTQAGASLSNASIDINNSTFNAGVTNTQPIGILLASANPRVNINSTTFGSSQTHSTGDISVSSAGLTNYVSMNNCLLSSTTELANQTNLSRTSYIGSEKHDQTSGNNKTFRESGIISIDTTIFDVTPSMRMTPNNATQKLESVSFKVACASGVPIGVSIKVRESVAGDGTDYNGNRIRLIVKSNFALGITSDTVLATATAASEGAFELISGTTASPSENGALEFTVDCDGTTGWVNIDSLSVTSIATDSTGFKYWKDGAPVVYGNNSAGGGNIFNILE